MLFFGVLAVVLGVTTANSCYSEISTTCGTSVNTDSELLSKCNAKFASFSNPSGETSENALGAYANSNIDFSFMFLLMSSHFGNYKIQREGFKHLYRKYSDKAWEDGVNLIKYVAKRGGELDYNRSQRVKEFWPISSEINLDEMHSLAKALSIQKHLAEEATHIHFNSNVNTKNDGAISHYIEEKFLEPLTDRVRDLSGYVHELKRLELSKDNPAVSVFLFDEFLKKSL